MNSCQKTGQQGQYLIVEGERERRQLAQKLHDGPIQHLTYISYRLIEYQKYLDQKPNSELQQAQPSEETTPTLKSTRLEVLDVVTQLR